MTALFDAGLSQRKACGSIGASRASWHRWQKRAPSSPTTAFHIVRSGMQPHALTVQERAAVLAVCNSERFYNSAPRAIVAALLDDGQYLASASTFYRILRAHGQLHERRAIATHPARIKPELMTTAPNRLWSWDVTKLPGPAKWTWFSLYLVLDVFSRYIVGWEVASADSTAIAKALFRDAVREQGVPPGQLHIHADGGAMMKAKSLALLFADLGISKSHSRPHTSNDNPYSEAQFKTLKYRPEFPEFFPFGAGRALVYGRFRALVQSRASSQRTGISHAGRRALRPGGRRARQAQRRHAASEAAASTPLSSHRSGEVCLGERRLHQPTVVGSTTRIGRMTMRASIQPSTTTECLTNA